MTGAVGARAEWERAGRSLPTNTHAHAHAPPLARPSRTPLSHAPLAHAHARPAPLSHATRPRHSGCSTRAATKEMLPPPLLLPPPLNRHHGGCRRARVSAASSFSPPPAPMKKKTVDVQEQEEEQEEEEDSASTVSVSTFPSVSTLSDDSGTKQCLDLKLEVAAQVVTLLDRLDCKSVDEFDAKQAQAKERLKRRLEQSLGRLTVNETIYMDDSYHLGQQPSSGLVLQRALRQPRDSPRPRSNRGGDAPAPS